MSTILEVTYHTTFPWALPIRAAIESKPALRARDAKWGQGRLSDLAFSISTRLGYLPDVIGLVEENLATLGVDLVNRGTETARRTREGKAYGFTFADYKAVRRVLIAAASFIAESRAGFENLSDFYREFLANYFDYNVGDKAAGYAAVASMTVCPQWATDLKNARHDVLHERSMWIAFEVRDTSPRYEPLLLLNWRPGRFQSKDCIKFQTLREIRDGLLEAAEGMRHRLIQRIETLP